jgi:hypothetical protein
MLMDDAVAPEVRSLADVMLAQARRVAHIVKRLSQLEAPKTVEYLTGEPMLDLSERTAH